MADVMFVKLNLGRVEVSTCKISVFHEKAGRQEGIFYENVLILH